MDKFSVYVPRLLPKNEYFVSGRRSCKGCGKALSARIASKAVTETPVPQNTPSKYDSLSSYGYAHDLLSFDTLIEQCLSHIDAINSTSAEKSRSRHTAIKKAVIGVNRQVFLKDYLALTRIFQSKKKAVYLCFDNEPYIDDLINKTGPQPFILNEAPRGVSEKDIKEVVREKNFPPGIAEEDFTYIATACPSFPFDLIAKMRKATACEGNAFLLILTPCPTGWIFPPRLTHRVGLNAVQTGYFPLYEKYNGKLRITERIAARKPLQHYLAMQKRFFTFSAELIPALQHEVNAFYDELRAQDYEG